MVQAPSWFLPVDGEGESNAWPAKGEVGVADVGVAEMDVHVAEVGVIDVGTAGI